MSVTCDFYRAGNEFEKKNFKTIFVLFVSQKMLDKQKPGGEFFYVFMYSW